MEDIILAIEKGSVYLVKRPKDSPKIIVRSYDIDRELKPWEHEMVDEAGKRCIESSWGD